MTDKYIQIDPVTGKKTQKAFITASSGSGSAGQGIAAGDDGLINVSFMPVGIGPEGSMFVPYEAMAAGTFVNKFVDTDSVTKIRKADASTGKIAHGFILASATIGTPIFVYAPSQRNTQLSGLTPGVTYWLSRTTPGAATASFTDFVTGDAIQILGYPDSVTSMTMESPDVVIY